MNKGTILFSECEHNGDLDTYIEDLGNSGATILSSEVNGDSEEGRVEIQVEDTKEFLKKFKETDSYGFSHLAR